MNKGTFRALGIACAAAVLAACGGGGGGGSPSGISPSDSNAVMEALLLKVGDATGTLIPNMEIPAASGVSTQPEVAVQRSLTQTTNGATAQIPLGLSSESPISRLFVKVGGSSSLIQVDLGAPSTAAALAEQRAAFETQIRSKELTEGMANLEVALPPNILEGSFDVQVAVQDEEGRVSLTDTATIQITRVGTGTLQFSLSWDAAVDLDLEVTDPSGNRIFFADPTSPTGGQLDRDDVDGGPGAIENIFWTSSAPNGRYEVDVNYFSGSAAANFVVTVSINGTIVDTISRANFQANDGRLPVYDLNFNGSAANSTGVIFPDRSASGGANDPTEVLARMQGTWQGCFNLGQNTSERDTLEFSGNNATSTYEFFPSSSTCDGTPSQTGVDTVTFVVGDAFQTTSGILANELDVTYVTSDEEGINPGDRIFDIVFVSEEVMLFGDTDFDVTDPSERPDTLDSNFVLTRVNF